MCLVDAASRVVAIGTDAPGLLGLRLRLDAQLQDAVHPDDAPQLMYALGQRSGRRRGRILDLRLRDTAGNWVPCRLQLSPLDGQNAPPYGVSIQLLSTGSEAAQERVSRLEGHLWRIALEVQAAGIGDPATRPEAWWAIPEVAELTERQAEILRRVMRGERIGAMARELNVTESTIRNHLSGVYRRFGVNSQAALLSRLLHAQA
jgi:DNA-binding CsgD family transcriptional regulator